MNFGQILAEGDPRGGDAGFPRSRSLYGHAGIVSLLQTQKLSAFYGDFQALFDIDVTVDEGETIAVIGANGARQDDVSARGRRRSAGCARRRSFSTASRSVDAARTTWFGSASPWFRRAAGCFPA